MSMTTAELIDEILELTRALDGQPRYMIVQPWFCRWVNLRLPAQRYGGMRQRKHMLTHRKRINTPRNR